MLIEVNRRLSPAGPSVNFPLAASAAHYGLATHFTSGLETPLVQVLAPIYALALLQPERGGLQAVIACSPLVRPELGLAVLMFAAWLGFEHRRVPWELLLAFVLVNGAWLAFRAFYYADFLPNTFYLKDDPNWKQGLWYARNVADAHRWPWVIALLLSAAWLGRHARVSVPAHARGAMLCIAAAYALYVVRIGGDMLYHRYAAFPVSLGLCASGGVCEAALERVPRSEIRKWIAPLAALFIAIVFGAAYPAQLLDHPLFSTNPHTRWWHKIADPAWHRHRADLMDAGSRARDVERRVRYANFVEPEAQALPIMTTGSCREAYENFGSRVIHNYGLTDPFLARIPGKFGRPGHKLVQGQANDLVSLEEQSVRAHHRPVDVRYWLKQGPLPKWIARNAEGLLLIERKMLNQHDFAQNLELAFTPVHLH
jgi:hypothetical protein